MSWRQFRSSPAIAAVCVVAGVVGIAARQLPQFRSGVDLVEVDIIVIDTKGRPVTDLSADDFEIRERGAIQRIETIYLVTADPTAARETPARPPFAGDAVVPVPRRPLEPRVFVFVFDLAHLSANGFNRSRTAIRRFLETGLPTQDLAGLVVNGEMLGNRIVSDKKALLGLLDAVKLPNLSRFNDMRQWPHILSEEEALLIARNNDRARNAAIQRACTERPEDCRGSGRAAVEAQIDGKAVLIAGESARDAQTTLTVLQTLANGLGRFPGPKQVILFSEGFYTGDFSERVTQVAGLAGRNRIRISTLDARGLNTDPRMGNIFGEAPIQGTGDLAVLGSDVDADVLTTLALETGGDRVRHRNDLLPSLDQIAAQSGTYYMLGYTPQTPFDGSYRTIEVKVRRPGVVVRARRGYLASKSTAQSPATDAGQERKTAESARVAPASPPVATTPVPPATPPVPPATPPVPPATPPSTLTATDPPATLPAAAASTPPADSLGASRLRLRPDRPADVAALGNRLSDPSPSTSERGAALARQGWDLYAAGKVEAARDQLAEASAAGGGVWVDYALGLAELTLRHAEPAIAAWQRVRTARPDYAPVYFDLADAYLMLNRTDNALAILREAARRWPADAEVHNAVGVVLFRRGAVDDAIDSFSRAVAAVPNDDTGHYNLGRAYHLRYIRRLQSGAMSTNAARSLGDRDRLSALEAYRKCVALAGPFEKQAREALTALEWR